MTRTLFEVVPTGIRIKKEIKGASRRLRDLPSLQGYGAGMAKPADTERIDPNAAVEATVNEAYYASRSKLRDRLPTREG